MKALRQEEPSKPFDLVDIPVPVVTPGNAIVQILAGTIHSYSRELWDGTRQVSKSANCGTSPKLMDYWKDGVFAQYKAAPLESVMPLNEERLIGNDKISLGYAVEDLAALGKLGVPFGGLKDVGVQPGETVIVAPATGGFGMTAVHLAVSLGARVIAMGRNASILGKLEKRYAGNVVGVTMAGTVEDNVKNIQEACAKLNSSAKLNQPDVFFDISPGFAADSPHIQASFLVLKRKGRVSFMGGLENVSLPYMMIMVKNLTIKGKWMYERAEMAELIHLIELGIVSIGKFSPFGKAHKFRLDQWSEAFDFAMSFEDSAVIVP